MMEVCSDLCCKVESFPDSTQLLKMNGLSLTKTAIKTKIIYCQKTHCKKSTSRLKLRAVQYVDGPENEMHSLCQCMTFLQLQKSKRLPIHSDFSKRLKAVYKCHTQVKNVRKFLKFHFF